MLFVGFVGFAVEEEEGQIRERSPTKQLAQPAWKRVTAFNELMKLHSYLHSKNYHKRKPKKNKRQLTSWSRIYSTYCYHQIAIIPTFCDIWCILSLLTYSLAILDLWAFLAFKPPVPTGLSKIIRYHGGIHKAPAARVRMVGNDETACTDQIHLTDKDDDFIQQNPRVRLIRVIFLQIARHCSDLSRETHEICTD